MDPIRLKLTIAGLGALALATTVLVVGGGRIERPAARLADARGEGILVERVTAPPGPLRLAEAREIVGRMPSGDAQETAAAIAVATRIALAAIAAAPDAPPDAEAAQAGASGFRRVEDAAPAFVISAADAWTAASQGWVAASGVAPVTIETRPRARRD